MAELSVIALLVRVWSYDCAYIMQSHQSVIFKSYFSVLPVCVVPSFKLNHTSVCSTLSWGIG